MLRINIIYLTVEKLIIDTKWLQIDTADKNCKITFIC